MRGDEHFQGPYGDSGEHGQQDRRGEGGHLQERYSRPDLSAGQRRDERLPAGGGNAKTNLAVVGQDLEFSYRFEITRPIGPHMRVCLTTETNRFEHLAVPLMGEHQAVNCGLALAMLDRLKQRGLNFELIKACLKACRG